jgi:Arc/MetJ family transcription regulator
MRTNIDIDDELLARAMRDSGAKTKKAAVEAGLRMLVEVEGQVSIRKLRGKIKWKGDLEESRLGRFSTGSAGGHQSQ